MLSFSRLQKIEFLGGGRWEVGGTTAVPIKLCPVEDYFVFLKMNFEF